MHTSTDEPGEERFRHYFELGLIGMAITSPTKGIIEVNDEICKILGYERSELLQMTGEELTQPDDVAADVRNSNRVWLGRSTVIRWTNGGSARTARSLTPSFR